VTRRFLLLILLVLAASPAAAGTRPFHVTPLVGIAAGGKVFEASTGDEEFSWITPDGDRFSAENVRVELDENILLGLRLGKGFTDRFSWEVSLAWTSMNMTAESLTFRRNFDTRNYDEMSATMVEANLVWDWVDQPTTPYFLAGLGWSSLGFMERRLGDSDLDQSTLSWVLGAGFRWKVLRLEVRDHLLPVDLEEEEARLGAESFDGVDLLQVWEISLGLSASF
jgi:hypothetical protein